MISVEECGCIFLKNKSQVFGIFQQFKALVEKESSFPIVTLRSNNGGEFCSNGFSSFCVAHGIKHQLITPYTPQQNGVVERHNLTIIEMARSMLEHRNVPRKYQVEAFYTIVYLMNRFPTHAVKKMTPEEAQFGRMPKVSHLKVFGFTAHVWIPDAKCAKLDSKSQKLMFIGYSENHKAYRLIDVDTTHLIFSGDVVVDETTGPFSLSSTSMSLEDQSMQAFDLGVCLPLAPPDGRDSVVVQSPQQNIPPPAPPQDNLDPHLADSILATPSDVALPVSDIGTSTLQPKWYAKTISDLCDDELSEGRTARKKSKQQNTINFALTVNLHSISEPQTYFEAKGVPEWEQAMEAEHHILLKK